MVGDLHSDGVGRGPKERKVGQRANLIGSLTFDDVPLPGDALLGEKNRGFHIMMSVLVKGWVGIGALSVGIAQADLEASVAFAGKRKQFGKEIARFQGVQWMLADMAKEIAASRLPVLDAAGKLERGEFATMSCSMAKCFAAGEALARTEDPVQVFGGSGYIRGFKVGRLYRDAKICQIYEGTYRIQQMILHGNSSKDAEFENEQSEKPRARSPFAVPIIDASVFRKAMLRQHEEIRLLARTAAKTARRQYVVKPVRSALLHSVAGFRP